MVLPVQGETGICKLPPVFGTPEPITEPDPTPSGITGSLLNARQLETFPVPERFQEKS